MSESARIIEHRNRALRALGSLDADGMPDVVRCMNCMDYHSAEDMVRTAMGPYCEHCAEHHPPDEAA